MARFDIKAYQHEVRMIRQRERRLAARLGVPVEHAVLPKVRDIKAGKVPVSVARKAVKQVKKVTEPGTIKKQKMVRPSKARKIYRPDIEKPAKSKPQQITIDDLLTQKPAKRVRKPREPWKGEKLEKQLDSMLKAGKISIKDKELVKNAVGLWPGLEFRSGRGIQDFIDFVKVRNEMDKGQDFYKLFEWSKAYSNLKSVGLKNAKQMLSEFSKYNEENMNNLARAKELDLSGYTAEEVLDLWDAIYTNRL